MESQVVFEAEVQAKIVSIESVSSAVVHDIFNWLTVIVLLIVEVVTGYLEHMSSAIVAGIPAGGDAKGEKPPDILKAITKPFTKVVIQIDKKVV